MTAQPMAKRTTTRRLREFAKHDPSGALTDMVVCPKCEGDGSGDGYGVCGAGGQCTECRGAGEVTRGRARRLIAAELDSNPLASERFGAASPPHPRDQALPAPVIAREWTRVLLDEVWPLPDEPDHWEWMEHGRTQGGVQRWAAVVIDRDYGDPEVASIVYIGANGWPCCECSAETRPSLAVVLAVIGAYLGNDSPAEMARKLTERAEKAQREAEAQADHARSLYSDGQAHAWRDASAMVTRGRVAP